MDATVLRVDPNSGEARQNGVTVSVSPASATVRAGHARTFTASVTGAPNSVTWSVNNAPGGNGTVGLIDAIGSYTAPLVIPNPATVTVRATSTASPSASGASNVTIIPLPSITSVSPSPVTVGNFTLTVNGVGFTAGAVVSFDGSGLPTNVVSSTRVTATGNAPAPKSSVPVVVTTTDGKVSNTSFVNVVSAPAVTVTISPTSASVRVRRTRQFTASVQNTANKGVIWKVNGITGGNSTVGTITASGLYRAPSSVPTPSVVTVRATSSADQTKGASASVTIRR